MKTMTMREAAKTSCQRVDWKQNLLTAGMQCARHVRGAFSLPLKYYLLTDFVVKFGI